MEYVKTDFHSYTLRDLIQYKDAILPRYEVIGRSFYLQNEISNTYKYE